MRAASAVVDFLVDERCHACGSPVDAAVAPMPLHPVLEALTYPVEAFGILRWSIRTRLLCNGCIARMDTCTGPVDTGAGDASLRVFPAFTTDARLLAVVHLLKFSKRECVAPWLGRAMTLGLPAAARCEEAMLVPVPMDRRARRRRGFNQAELIARRLAREWALPIETGALRKPAPTAAQSLLGRAERERNLVGAFRLGGPSVAGRCVLLVDDLVTTGATARACAHELRRGGASDVRVLCAGYRPLHARVFP